MMQVSIKAIMAMMFQNRLSASGCSSEVDWLALLFIAFCVSVLSEIYGFVKRKIQKKRGRNGKKTGQKSGE